jgi:hypothetical protein
MYLSQAHSPDIKSLTNSFRKNNKYNSLRNSSNAKLEDYG